MTSCPAVPAVTAHEQMSVFPRRRHTVVVFAPWTLQTYTHVFSICTLLAAESLRSLWVTLIKLYSYVIQAASAPTQHQKCVDVQSQRPLIGDSHVCLMCGSGCVVSLCMKGI